MSASLKARLKLTLEKLQTLAKGIRDIASDQEPIGRVLKRTELSDGLILEQRSVPIGVILGKKLLNFDINLKNLISKTNSKSKSNIKI